MTPVAGQSVDSRERHVEYVLGRVCGDAETLVVVLGVLQPLDGVSLLARVAQLCRHRQPSSTVLTRRHHAFEQRLTERAGTL